MKVFSCQPMRFAWKNYDLRWKSNMYIHQAHQRNLFFFYKNRSQSALLILNCFLALLTSRVIVISAYVCMYVWLCWNFARTMSAFAMSCRPNLQSIFAKLIVFFNRYFAFCHYFPLTLSLFEMIMGTMPNYLTIHLQLWCNNKFWIYCWICVDW